MAKKINIEFISDRYGKLSKKKRQPAKPFPKGDANPRRLFLKKLAESGVILPPRKVAPKKKKIRPGWVPAKPFVIGNKAAFAHGRPKGSGTKTLVESYKIVLEDPCFLRGYEDVTWAEAMSIGMAYRCTLNGDANVAREMREATTGKSTERIEHSGPQGQPLQLAPLHVHFISSLEDIEKLKAANK